jgi:thiosulfate dehydrogenase [quinone] large subunit
MASKSVVNPKGEIVIPDPPIARLLFASTKISWIWLILRVYLGYMWLSAGWGKISGGTWMTGEPLKGFWIAAVKIPEQGKPPIAFDWYRGFIQFMLDNGAYTWIAAFFGAFMNWNFIMAGAASTNALLFTIAILLVVAWKVAGWWGLDRWLLPIIGTPWYRVDPAVGLQTTKNEVITAGP